MLRHILVSAGLAGALLPVPAFAQAVIERSGAGRACYEATLLDSTPLHDQQALATCDKALVDEANDSHNRAAILVNRADIRLRLRDFEGAVTDAEQGIALSPLIPAAYLNRGAGLIGLKLYGEAVSSLDKAIEMGTSRPQLAYFDRGIAKESLGDIPGAYRDYKMAFDLDPKFGLAGDQVSRFSVTTREDISSQPGQ